MPILPGIGLEVGTGMRIPKLTLKVNGYATVKLMAKPRGKEHTTLTETAAMVLKIVSKMPDIKMIAPGEIKTTSKNKSGKRYVTIVYTNAGCELIITGQSVQKIAVHTENPQNILLILKSSKSLKNFSFKERNKKPGV